MRPIQMKSLVVSVCFALGICLITPAVQVAAQNAAGQPASVPKSETGVSASPVTAKFYSMAQGASAVIKRVGNIITGKQGESLQWSEVVAKLSGGRGTFHLLLTLIGVAVVIAVGLALQQLFLRATADIRQNLLRAARLGKLQLFGRILSRMILDALGTGVFILVTFIIFVLAYQQGRPSYVISSVYLIVSYYLAAFAFGARVIFSPKAPSLRLFPMEDQDASFLYQWIIRIILIAGFFAGASSIFKSLNISKSLHLLAYSFSGVAIILALLIMIWQSRKRVAQAIWTEGSDTEAGSSSMRAALAGNWQYFATIYVVVAGGIWVTKALNEEPVTVVNLIVSIFLIPIVIGVDQWVQRLLKIASGESRETIDLSGDAPADSEAQPEPESKMDIANYIPLIKRSFRAFLVLFLIFSSLRLWGIDISIGRMFTRSALSILVVLLLSFITWQLFKARIDQKLKEEMPEDDDEAEEGGAGGTRMGTLLVLLRKFVLAVMFVVVSLIILSSIGVNIGPLIAGAGVFGLAIGFGAQTLVKDIIAGVFFLIDDAFRVGDYVEAGGTKGMVEHISLRSLKLRNPRGMVHNIPFGGMGTVTNFSRDYIVTKLRFRVRYDTDIDKVRKILKRINKDIQKDEKMSAVILGKIKSQGVREMDDSAMIMGVKFKTLPGEQFVVRRELYRRMQEDFKANGIEFAHRNVTVYMPPEAEGGTSGDGQPEGAAAQKTVDKKRLEAGAAAAIASSQDGGAGQKA